MARTVPSQLANKFTTENVVEFLRRFKADDEYERCAVILGTFRSSISLVEVPNVSQWAEGFAIARRDLNKALRATQRPLFGYLHTHLPQHDPMPSEWDLEGCAKHPELVYAVYHPAKRRLVIYQSMKTYYRLEDVPIHPITRRKK